MTVLRSRPAQTAVLGAPAPPVDPGLLSRALEVAGRLANDAAEVINATAGRTSGSVLPGAERAMSGVERAVPPGAERKGAGDEPFDWVTDTDRTLERHTRRVLAAEFPDIPVVGEEYGADPSAAGATYRWVVDPVDGTANYVAGLPWYAYSLGLVDAQGPVVGVIADPSRAQIYAAARGRGIRANGAPVRSVAPVPDASHLGALICAESPSRGFVERAAAHHVAVRVLGSSALAIAQVALGRVVATVLDGYHEWDVAGALCLALEAGAVVLDAEGRPDPLPSGGLVVARPDLAEEVHRWWRG